MYEPDRFLTACMPLIPMLAALYIMLEIWNIFKEWAEFTMKGHAAMKRKLADIQEKKLESVQKELEELKKETANTSNVRGKSPAARRG